MNLYPSNQINLYEHKKLFNLLSNVYENIGSSSKILLSGEKGIGKSTLAYHIINYVLSKKEEDSYDCKNNVINVNNRSFKLIQNKSNPNFHLLDISVDKKFIDINQVRELISILNKSSFNNKPRFVLIDNIELLNINSVNALLKIIEEPNENIHFILINNCKRILPTIKSRCLNFNVSINYSQSIKIINQILNDDIFNIINNDLVNNYMTPGLFVKIINFSNEFDINLKNLDLKKFLKVFINQKLYKKDNSSNKIIYFFIELYFRKNVSVTNIILLDTYYYFLKKISNTKIYNLDEDSLFVEFEEKVLNG
tara:strand:- start:602 stop:1531 length:930 start_codon:yes stop_codon:yes gene_type:complete